MGDYPLVAQRDGVKDYRIRGFPPSQLSLAYMSTANIKIVQNALRYKVWEASKGKILVDQQSETELVVIMRGVYLQHAKHLPHDIRGQIAELNDRVVAQAAPIVLSNALQHQQYLVDRETRHVMPHSVNVSSAGTKTLRSVTSTF